MELRRLGRTDLNVSMLCLGTMTWGEQNDEAEAHAQMDLALAEGINFFDTAEMYPIPRKRETQGRTEEMIGSWLAARGGRDKVVLATKVVGRDGGDWFRDEAVTRLTRKQIAAALNASLRRLRTDYIDLYQLHWPDRQVSAFGANPVIYKAPAGGGEVSFGEQCDALADLVRAGKIRHVGLSNESAYGVMRFLAVAEAGGGAGRMCSIQNAYSLVNRTFETNLAEIAMREQVGLLAYSPLGQGVLTGKYLNGARPAGARDTLFNSLTRYKTPAAAPAIGAYVALAREWGLNPAQMALKFVTTRPFVTSTIIGATTLDQLKINIASQHIQWTGEIERRIDDIHLLHTNPCP